MNKPQDSKHLLLAHRGTSTMAPENTAPAFDFAMTHSADVLEIDVRLSRDNQVVVIHDEAVDRTTNGSGVVRQKVLGELKALDAAYRFTPIEADREAVIYPLRGTGVTLLTLGELFEQYPLVGVNIDIKDNDTLAIDKVADLVESHHAVNRVVIASFHDPVLRYCRQRYPWMTTSAGMTDVKRFYWWYLKGQAGPVPVSVKLFQLPVRYFLIPLASQRFVHAVHHAQASVNYWTVNNPALMRSLIDKGADGIVTDRADLAREALISH